MVKVPTLGIVGTLDHTLKEMQALAKARPAMKFVLLEGASHTGATGILAQSALVMEIRSFIAELAPIRLVRRDSYVSNGVICVDLLMSVACRLSSQLRTWRCAAARCFRGGAPPPLRRARLHKHSRQEPREQAANPSLDEAEAFKAAQAAATARLCSDTSTNCPRWRWYRASVVSCHVVSSQRGPERRGRFNNCVRRHPLPGNVLYSSASASLLRFKPANNTLTAALSWFLFISSEFTSNLISTGQRLSQFQPQRRLRRSDRRARRSHPLRRWFLRRL